MNKQSGFSLAVIVLIIAGVIIIAGGGVLVYQNYNTAPKPATCTPNWQCGWGECTNGYQSQIAIDSNNCGTTAGNNIACTALARECVSLIKCKTNSDCPKIVCKKAPCSAYVCVNGECIMSDTQPSITVTSPNGGENWVAGTTHNITWTGGNLSVTSYSIYITGSSNLGPTGSSYIGTAYPTANVTGGIFSWTIPSTMQSGNNYQILFINGTTSVGNSSKFNIVAQ